MSSSPHRRRNALTGEWVLVSPQRSKRPWQGQQEQVQAEQRPAYDAGCYLCPGNTRAGGQQNAAYKGPWAFTNDFAALEPLQTSGMADRPVPGALLQAEEAGGTCRVICFSPRHDLTLPQMEVPAIAAVVDLWAEEFSQLSADPGIHYIQIFENKGEVMGCSNPHPHGQIWASTFVPPEIEKEDRQQRLHHDAHGRTLLEDYLAAEMADGVRLLDTNEHFVSLVPFWATWPFEALVLPKRHVQTVVEFTQAEREALAAILKALTSRYDNLFGVSFPYSAGMHQAPVNLGTQPHWQWHMHFYPPLLRSATVKKFMVGYEMLAGPQRDLTPEQAAERLRALPAVRSF